MIYVFLYVVGLILILYIYKVGWLAALKTIISIIVPSFLIIIFNIKAGRLLFKSPIIGILSALPTSVFIFRGSKPIVNLINNWLENTKNSKVNNEDVIDTESMPVED